MYFHHCWAVDKDTGWTVCLSLRIVRGGLPLSSRSVMVSLPLRDIVDLFNYFFLNPTVGRLGLRCWAAKGLLLPWTKKKEPSSRFAARRTLFHVWYHARSGAISAGQVRSATVRDFCPALIAPDRAWYHTWNSVLLAANLEDGSFFLSKVVVDLCLCCCCSESPEFVGEVCLKSALNQPTRSRSRGLWRKKMFFSFFFGSLPPIRIQSIDRDVWLYMYSWSAKLSIMWSMKVMSHLWPGFALRAVAKYECALARNRFFQFNKLGHSQ